MADRPSGLGERTQILALQLAVEDGRGALADAVDSVLAS
jgi:hypothetical protein